LVSTHTFEEQLRNCNAPNIRGLKLASVHSTGATYANRRVDRHRGTFVIWTRQAVGRAQDQEGIPRSVDDRPGAWPTVDSLELNDTSKLIFCSICAVRDFCSTLLRLPKTAAKNSKESQ
jgi:hypothetical protein